MSDQERLDDIRSLTKQIVCDSITVNGRIYYAVNPEMMMADLKFLFEKIDQLDEAKIEIEMLKNHLELSDHRGNIWQDEVEKLRKEIKSRQTSLAEGGPRIGGPGVPSGLIPCGRCGWLMRIADIETGCWKCASRSTPDKGDE